MSNPTSPIGSPAEPYGSPGQNDPYANPGQNDPYAPPAGGSGTAYPSGTGSSDPGLYGGAPSYGSAPYGSSPYAQSPYGQPPYGAAPYGYQGGSPYPSGPRTNPLAVVSLVLSVLGLTFFPVIASIGGVITGHMARRAIRDNGEGGAGLAVAGLVVGYVGVALLSVFVLFFVMMVAAIPMY